VIKIRENFIGGIRKSGLQEKAYCCKRQCHIVLLRSFTVSFVHNNSYAPLS